MKTNWLVNKATEMLSALLSLTDGPVLSNQVTGRCGSVLVRLIPAPRGTGIVSAPVPKKLLMMAGIDDCYTSARGCTATLGNFGKFCPHSLACRGEPGQGRMFYE